MTSALLIYPACASASTTYHIEHRNVTHLLISSETIVGPDNLTTTKRCRAHAQMMFSTSINVT